MTLHSVPLQYLYILIRYYIFPEHVKSLNSIFFRHHLKTHIFRPAYPSKKFHCIRSFIDEFSIVPWLWNCPTSVLGAPLSLDSFRGYWSYRSFFFFLLLLLLHLRHYSCHKTWNITMKLHENTMKVNENNMKVHKNTTYIPNMSA